MILCENNNKNKEVTENTRGYKIILAPMQGYSDI